MSNATSRPFVRRIERWLVSLVMAAMAYMLEMAVLRSIRRRPGKLKPSEKTLGENSSETDDTA